MRRFISGVVCQARLRAGAWALLGSVRSHASSTIRHIQQMLGYARLSITGIYTHVNIAHLADVHRRSHPAGQRPLPGDI